MAAVSALAFLVGHFTGYGADETLDAEGLAELASLSLVLGIVATLGVSGVVPVASMLADVVLNTGTTFMTGVTGAITTPMQAIVESVISGLIAALATPVGYGAKVVATRLQDR